LIDFPDEDIPIETFVDAKGGVSSLLQDLVEHLARSKKSLVISHGINVAIIGPPNSGKSSLLNLLTQKDMAIVSDIAGTTRDVVQAQAEIDGLRVIWSDTAGIRDARDVIESEGVSRAKFAAAKADVIVLIFDINVDGQEILDFFEDADFLTQAENIVCLLNKSDLMQGENITEEEFIKSVRAKENLLIQTSKNLGFRIDDIVSLSVLDVRALEEVIACLERFIAVYNIADSEVLTSSFRQMEALRNCAQYLESFLRHDLLDVAVQDLRYAALELGYLTGKNISVDEITDKLFEHFCIGK
jgi:tRNA modification GTPase